MDISNIGLIKAFVAHFTSASVSQAVAAAQAAEASAEAAAACNMGVGVSGTTIVFAPVADSEEEG